MVAAGTRRSGVNTTPAKNDRESFEPEFERLRRDGGPESDGNDNKIASPGKRYAEQDKRSPGS